MGMMAIICACGHNSKWHVTCAKCTIQLKALVRGGLDLGFPEKSKRFSFTPCVQISNVSQDGEWWESFVIIVKPSSTGNGPYSRVGIGYIFRAEVFAALQQEVITIV
jgi:hypothetical protein